MNRFLTKISFIFASFTLFAQLAHAMDEYSHLTKYEKSSFWNIESGQFRLSRDLPIIVYAAYFVDGPGLTERLTFSFKKEQTLSIEGLVDISKETIKSNALPMLGWLGFLSANFCFSGINSLHEIFWLRSALETTQLLADILIILNHFACKYQPTQITEGL